MTKHFLSFSGASLHVALCSQLPFVPPHFKMVRQNLVRHNKTESAGSRLRNLRLNEKTLELAPSRDSLAKCVNLSGQRSVVGDGPTRLTPCTKAVMLCETKKQSMTNPLPPAQVASRHATPIWRTCRLKPPSHGDTWQVT